MRFLRRHGSESPISIVGLTTVAAPADALRQLREGAEHALQVPTGKSVVHGRTRSVSLVPHVLAHEAIRRIDDGGTSEEILPWFLREMETARRWRILYRWRRRRWLTP